MIPGNDFLQSIQDKVVTFLIITIGHYHKNHLQRQLYYTMLACSLRYKKGQEAQYLQLALEVILRALLVLFYFISLFTLCLYTLSTG